MQHIRSRTRSLLGLATASLSLALALTGCSTASTETSSSSSAGACTGIEVIVEFGELGGDTIEQCVDSESKLTALDAFTAAGVDIAPSEAYGDAIVCRVDGQPGAELELSTAQNGPYVETCAEFGPVWASWSLWVDTGDGWELGQEAVNTQPLEPGQRVSLLWQQGDYSEMGEWLKPTV